MGFDKLNFPPPPNYQQRREEKIAACTQCKKNVVVWCGIFRRKLCKKLQRVALALLGTEIWTSEKETIKTAVLRKTCLKVTSCTRVELKLPSQNDIKIAADLCDGLCVIRVVLQSILRGFSSLKMGFNKLNFPPSQNYQQREEKIAACTRCKKNVIVWCGIVRRKLRKKFQRVALALLGTKIRTFEKETVKTAVLRKTRLKVTFCTRVELKLPFQNDIKIAVDLCDGLCVIRVVLRSILRGFSFPFCFCFSRIHVTQWNEI